MARRAVAEQQQESKPRTGREVLEKGDKRAFKLLSIALLAKAKKARHDFKAFFEFVMEEENTKAPVKMAPHQEVVAEFMLAHRRGVVMMPRGHSKSFLLLALILWSIGRDPNFRGAIVSATQEQAAKMVLAVRQYIESNPRLRLVFPNLRPTTRKGEPWTQTAITVHRPHGTRDATLVALGFEGAVLGARLKFVAVDDILTAENTHTHESRTKVIEWVDAAVLQTLDRVGDARAYFVGTAFHPDDLLHVATKRGWATMKMDVMGNVSTQDDVDPVVRVDGGEQWDTDKLRPGTFPYERLAAHDPDKHEEIILWPGRFGLKVRELVKQKHALEKLQREMLPTTFQQMYMMVGRDAESALFRQHWFDKCKENARKMGFKTLATEYDGSLPTFTGVDLGIGIGEHNDDTCLFTYCVLESGHRLVLDVDCGKFDGAKKVAKVREKVERFNSWVVMVESNGGQKMLAEWALDQDVSLPVRAQQTGANKAHVEIGIPGLALEVYNGAWLLPNDDRGNCHPNLERAIREAVNYVADKHTGDALMGWWLAQQAARSWGIGTRQVEAGSGDGLGSFMTR
jgi:hypothetical protein